MSEPGQAHFGADCGEPPDCAPPPQTECQALGLSDLLEAPLPLGAQIQVVLVEQADQFLALGVEAVVQVGVTECARAVASRKPITF
jgi:hypothetical protein